MTSTPTATSLRLLTGGSLYQTASDFVPGAFGVIEMPVCMFLIEHPDGLVLVDTGLSPESIGDDEQAYAVYGSLRPVSIVKNSRDQLVDAQLAAAGHAASDLSHVIVSHGHFDHAGGLPLVQDAGRIVLHAREWEHIRCAAEHPWPGPLRVGDYSTVDEAKLELIDGDLDLFDDGSVIVYDMPGHSPGNLSVLVRLTSQSILLTLDTVHQRAGYETDAVGVYDHDAQQTVASIRRVKEIEASTGARVWITHDFDDYRTFGPAGRVHV